MENNQIVTNTVNGDVDFLELSSATFSIQNRWDPSEPGVAELLKQGAHVNFCK